MALSTRCCWARRVKNTPSATGTVTCLPISSMLNRAPACGQLGFANHRMAILQKLSSTTWPAKRVEVSAIWDRRNRDDSRGETMNKTSFHLAYAIAVVSLLGLDATAQD